MLLKASLTGKELELSCGGAAEGVAFIPQASFALVVLDGEAGQGSYVFEGLGSQGGTDRPLC